MKALIVYATKYGSTKQVAGMIAEAMGGADLADLGGGGAPALAGYDCVVLGSPLTAGSIRKEIKGFAAQHAGELAQKHLGLFVCGLQGEGEAVYLEQNYPSELVRAARAKAFLGGVFDPRRCGFLARRVIGAVAKLDGYTSTIDSERVRRFAEELES